MFSDLILRNSKRSRKENGLFFSSLVISIIAFYIILSLSHQDVMIFLAKMESDAVSRLLLMIPVFYVVTLAILFFLIYFACKYQLERRRKEFGVYLMMGMRRGKLFAMLLAEDLLESGLALVIGLPVAVLISELISLITAKLVGMGIIGHQFSLSISAIIFTIVGFLVIKFAAFLILSSKISRQEIGILLKPSVENEKKAAPAVVYGISAAAGIGMLAATYSMAISGISWSKNAMMFLTLVFGFVGTILLFYGMRALIALLIKKGNINRKLHVFTFRQIQENVIHQSTSMAISSLLILAALCCFGAGIGIAGVKSQAENHVLDYTFRDYSTESPEEVLPHLEKTLLGNGLIQDFSQIWEMRIGHVYETATDTETAAEDDTVISFDSVIDEVRKLPQSEARDLVMNELEAQDMSQDVYLICLSDYNKLLAAAGKPTLTLAENEAAVYQDRNWTNDAENQLFHSVLSEKPEIILNQNPVKLTGEVQTVNLVTDRSITLSFALILPDDQFLQYTNGDYTVYVNAILNRENGKSASLMSVISDMNERLDNSDLSEADITYESYLQNMGRQLFYMVAASYITIYLGIIFLVVANTIIGVQFLMNQQKTGRRYQTLVRLGATYQDLCVSARKQINWFVGLPVFVAAVSSLFGVRSLFTGMLSSAGGENQGQMIAIAAAMIALLCVVECVYMAVIRRSSDRYLLTLMQPQREE
ncbi:ABC transporter permease [uncultured Eubacterium sp.]|uniref:ABC transporter permease n=1 Tax=uncultured Eubacterium sp. TaxID=165185 RepID=UPI0026008F0B|nr:ABC transporter permease [uncultured Eubacterium sp.]